MDISATVVSRFSWDYRNRDEKLLALYEKAKHAQWDARVDVDWSGEIQFGAPLRELPDWADVAAGPPPGCPVPAERWHDYRWQYHSWMTSQFLHGEQGALMATARLVETLPDHDSKRYAASQVADEARHVEAFAMYLERLGTSYPINPALRDMLANLMSESRWDIIYLGNQIIVEGLALAAFRFGHTNAFDPVIRQIIQLVARDEARHVAFGVLALQGLYAELSSREKAEREEFVNESALLMARRFQLAEVWDNIGVDRAEGIAYATHDPVMKEFRRLMFSKIVSNLAKLGMMTPPVRAHLEQLALVRP